MSTTNSQQTIKKNRNSDKTVLVKCPNWCCCSSIFCTWFYGLLYFALLTGYVTDDERLGAYVLVLMDCTYIASPTVNFVIYCRFLKHYRKAVVDVRNFVFCIHNLRRRSSGVTTTETVWSEENFMIIKREANVPRIGNFRNLAL